MPWLWFPLRFLRLAAFGNYSGKDWKEYNLILLQQLRELFIRYTRQTEKIDLTNPSNLPDLSEIDYMEEPMVKAEIMVTTEFIGPIMDLCQERRGQYQGMEYMGNHPCPASLSFAAE